MRYFTPELYVQGNSEDPDLVDQTEVEWERAIKRYRRHYKKIAPQLPDALRNFHDRCCLHDADVFGPARLSLQTIPWGFQDVVIVVQNINTLFAEHLNTLTFLQYAVTAEPVVTVPFPHEVFRTGQPIWLYDEIDVVEPDVFSHEIFISDGRVVKVLFREFRYQFAPLVGPQDAATSQVLPQGKAASA
jgi:hypothetical protein